MQQMVLIRMVYNNMGLRKWEVAEIGRKGNVIQQKNSPHHRRTKFEMSANDL